MPPAENNTSINQPLLDEIVSRLNEANNVLVTVSNNPSVDQLAACIALTVALNKKDKHATAVFSGAVPSTIEFLEPDKTIEKTTDSLRDFIISLDKAKADKLRYKVEDEVVKIFITPYRTSITENDLQFSQGDFNVDAVVAVGVHNRSELDAAIVAHGRILHDATVISVNNTDGAELGSLHWYEKNASSLSEMTCDLIKAMDSSVFDEQIANALLTGIVAETDRFRSEKATPHTMTISGILMAAGASPQLVSSKLEQPPEPPKQEEKPEEPAQEEGQGEPEAAPEPPKENDGVIQIEHDPNDIHIDDTGKLKKVSEIIKEVEDQAEIDDRVQDQPDESLPQPQGDEEQSESPQASGGSNMIYEPPTFGGQLTANTQPVDQQYASNPDPLAPPVVPQRQILGSAPPVIQPPDIDDKTLTDIEKSVNSPHVNGYVEPLPQQTPPTPAIPDVPPVQPDYARDAVQRAVQGSTDYRPEPIQSLGANPLADNLNPPGSSQQNNDSNDTPAGPPPPPVPPPLPPSA